MQNVPRALRWFSKAAEQDEPLAQGWLGICHYAGVEAPQDLVQAYKWLSIASESGDATFKLALLQVEQEMTKKQILEGRQLAIEFKLDRSAVVE